MYNALINELKGIFSYGVQNFFLDGNIKKVQIRHAKREIEGRAVY